ncbi:MAG: hypothetical protein AAF922_18305 [Pseudomonadota bacterium]
MREVDAVILLHPATPGIAASRQLTTAWTTLPLFGPDLTLISPQKRHKTQILLNMAERLPT